MTTANTSTTSDSSTTATTSTTGGDNGGNDDKKFKIPYWGYSTPTRSRPLHSVFLSFFVCLWGDLTAARACASLREPLVLIGVCALSCCVSMVVWTSYVAAKRRRRRRYGSIQGWSPLLSGPKVDFVMVELVAHQIVILSSR